MASTLRYQLVGRRQPGFWLLGLGAGALLLAGLGAAYYMAAAGHAVTGMSNRIVWGLPHAFAIALILAATGALMVTALGSLLGRAPLRPLGRLGGVTAAALLLGGLAVLVLDLGRPDRLVVAMTHFNPASSFARNIVLYNGFLLIVALYLATRMAPAAYRYERPAAALALAWPLLLAANVGSIFALLPAREAYGGAIMVPLLIAAALAYGTAALALAALGVLRGQGRRAPAPLAAELSRLLAAALAATILLLAVHFLALAYDPATREAARFLLVDGGPYPAVMWLGAAGVGLILPSLLLAFGASRPRARTLPWAAGLTLAGGLALLFGVIVGAQAQPLTLFPGAETAGSAFDGEAAHYRPSGWEAALGLGGVALTVIALLAGLRALPLLPRRLPDEPPSAAAPAPQQGAAAAPAAG